MSSLSISRNATASTASSVDAARDFGTHAHFTGQPMKKQQFDTPKGVAVALT